MKKKHFYTLIFALIPILLILAFVSCEKEEIQEPTYPANEFTEIESNDTTYLLNFGVVVAYHYNDSVCIKEGEEFYYFPGFSLREYNLK